MKNLFAFELHKLLRQKSFYICAGVMLVTSFLGLLLNKAAANSEELNIAMPTAASSLLTAVSSSNFAMICGIFIALFVCKDYDRQTIKNVYSRGFSRDSVYFAKYSVGVIATAVMFAVTLVFTYVAAGVMFDGAAEKGNYVWPVVGQFLYCLAYAAFVFAVSLTVKKVGASIALAVLGPSLIGTVLNLADAFLKIENFKMGRYWLDGFIGDLSSLSTDNARLTVCIALSAVYAAVFIFAGYYINKKREG